MLKVLLKLRLREQLSRLTKAKRRGIAGNLGSTGYLILLIGIYCFMMYNMFTLFDPFAGAMKMLNLGSTYFGYASIVGFGLAIIGSAFSTQSQLFEAKDNDTLLSFPIRPSTILASRMISLYILALVYESLMLLPAGAAWFKHAGITVSSFFSWLIPSLFVPMIALTIGCIVGWLLAILSSHVQNKSYLQMGVSALMLAGYFFIFFRATSEMDALTTGMQIISGQMLRAIWPASQYGLACAGNWKSVGFVILVSVLPLCLVWKIISQFFFHIVNEHHHVRKKEYVPSALRVLTPRRALIQRERRRLFSDGSYVINAGIGILMAFIITVIFAIFYPDLRDGLASLHDMLAPAAETAGQDFAADMMSIGMFLATILLCMMATTVTITAPSLSLEGKTIWQAGVLPIRAIDFLMAKVALHFLLSAPVFLICSLIFEVLLKGSILMRILLIFSPMAMNLLIALFGMVMNVIHPKFDWTSSQQCIKRSLPVAVCMLGSMFLIFGAGFVYFNWLYTYIAPSIFLGICTILMLILSAGMYFWLRSVGSRKLQTYYAL